MRVTAACHIHSEWSYDARWSLPELAAEFAIRQQRILLVTEHDRGFSEGRLRQHRRACAEASSDDLLIVPGIEYSDPDNVVHILTWGLGRFLGENLPTARLLETVKAENGVAVMAHPGRREAWRRYNSSWADYLLGIELWNRKADGWAPSPSAAALLKGTDLVAFASLDFHNSKQMFPLSMQLEVDGAITEENVIDCLRQGRCRAMAFSKPVLDLLTSWRGSMLAPVEKMRRAAASAYRGVKWVAAR